MFAHVQAGYEVVKVFRSTFGDGDVYGARSISKEIKS